MFAGIPYGVRYTFSYRSEDGRVYVAKVEMANYGGAATNLSADGPRSGLYEVVVQGGEAAAQAGDELAPFAASVATLHAADGRARLGGLTGHADGVVRLRLYSGATEATATTPEWAGYLIGEVVADTPLDGLNPVALRFMDGPGFLAQRAHAGEGTDFVTTLGAILPGQDDERSLVEQLAAALGPLGGGSGASDAAYDGLVTCADWRPYVGVGAGEVAAGTDPLFAVKSFADAWLDADGASLSQLAALKQIAARFNAQLYLSGGPDSAGGLVWRLDQRGALARAYGGDGVSGSAAGTVPTWTYAADGDGAITVPGTVPTRTDEDRLLDVHAAGAVVNFPSRAFPIPTREAEASYEFRPGLESLVVNGGFEAAGAGGAATAEGWTLGGAAARTEDTGADATANDRWFMRLPGHAVSGGTPATCSQADLVYIAAAPEMAVEVDFTATVTKATAALQSDGSWAAFVGGFPLRAAAVEVAQDQIKGRAVRVRLAEKLVSGPNTIDATGDADAVDGTEILAAGTVVRFSDTDSPELTLSAPARVGDLSLSGDLSGDLTAGVDGLVYYFGPDGAAEFGLGVSFPQYPASTSGTLTDRAFRVFGRCLATACDGAAVSGYVSLEVGGPALDVPAGDTGRLDLDAVAVRVLSGSSPVSAMSHRAALPPGATGETAALPARADAGHRLGDGPHPDTLSRLRVVGANGTTYETQQGADTGWTEGAYPSDGSAVSTGRPVGALAVVDALRQLVGPGAEGPAERWAGEIVLGPDTPVRAHHVVRVWQRTTLAYPLTAGSDTAVMYAAPRPGEAVTFRPGTAAAETLTVDSVTRGLGTHAVTFTAAASGSHPATSDAHYTLVVWRDGWTWRTAAGRLHLEATALAAAPLPDLIESISYE